MRGMGYWNVRRNFKTCHSIISPLVFGFGSFLAGSDLFTIQIAARVHYALTDMLSAEGEAINYPSGKAYPDYTNTRALAAQIGLDVVFWVLGIFFV